MFLEISEVLLAKCRNPAETEEGMVSGSSKDASSSGVSRVSENGIQDHAHSHQLLDPKRSNPHTLVQVGRGLVLPMKPR